jgi:serine/threonine-protein kinase RsbW
MATAALQLVVRRSVIPELVPDGARVSLTMPSDIDCIEHAVSLVARHCLAGVPASSRLRFRLQVAVAEALANAVLQGNRQDPAKLVSVQAELHPDVVVIHVTDEGDGFDPARVPDPLSPDQMAETGGRGLFLIRKLVDDVRFNERGTSICMTFSRR